MTRPRALVVTPRMPWPQDDGGRIGLWQSLRSVARDYDTTLVALVPPGTGEGQVPAAISSLGVEVVCVPHTPPPRPIAAWMGMFGPWPYTLERYRSGALDTVLRRLVAERNPAFALVNHLHLATYLDAFEGVPVVLREHNVEHLWLELYADSLANPLVRAYARAQARRMRITESELCSRCSLVLAMHEEDVTALRAIAPRARVEAVPVGVDLAQYAPHAPEDPPIVLLAASFAWGPNVVGARRFLEEGWALLRRRVPQVQLRLVGKQLPDSLARLARSVGAEPVGYVESMIPEFARASALLVPLWVGVGARVKIVEALAASVPVVSTPLGAQGLGLSAGEHYLAADDPSGLGERLRILLENRALAERLAQAGYQFAQTHFSLDAVVELTCALCTQVALPTASSRPPHYGAAGSSTVGSARSGSDR